MMSWPLISESRSTASSSIPANTLGDDGDDEGVVRVVAHPDDDDDLGVVPPGGV